MFNNDGRFVDTSLPMSDDLSEEIGSFFFAMAEEYRRNDRPNNVFSAQFGDTVLIYAEHAFGAFLFMAEGAEEVDEILSRFVEHYSPAPVESSDLRAAPVIQVDFSQQA